MALLLMQPLAADDSTRLQRSNIVQIAKAAEPYLNCSSKAHSTNPRLRMFDPGEPPPSDFQTWMQNYNIARQEMDEKCNRSDVVENIVKSAMKGYPNLNVGYVRQRVDRLVNFLETTNREFLDLDRNTQDGLPVVVAPPVMSGSKK
jgi:hypothetical protein